MDAGTVQLETIGYTNDIVDRLKPSHDYTTIVSRVNTAFTKNADFNGEPSQSR